MQFTPEQIGGFLLALIGAILTIFNIRERWKNMRKEAEAPFNTLKSRVDGHDVEISDIKMALKLGNDKFRAHDEKFREQAETDAAFKTIMLSFVNFEVAYCLYTGYEHTEDLMVAKQELEKYLTGKKHYEDRNEKHQE